METQRWPIYEWLDTTVEHRQHISFQNTYVIWDIGSFHPGMFVI